MFPSLLTRGREVLKIGTFGWLVVAIVGAELLVWIKLSRNQFPHLTGHPPIIVASWAVVIAATALFTVFYFYIGRCHEKRPSPTKTTDKMKKN
jgi:hypothetical protein